MTNKDFKEGMEVTYKVYDMTFEGTLHKDKKGWWVIVTSPPYVDVYIQDDWKEGDDDITNIQPKHRTIDDLECGDYVNNHYSGTRKCIGKCGEVYLLSLSGEYDFFGVIRTMKELKEERYTLYQPTEETDIDRCIKIVKKYFENGDTFSKERKQVLFQALKNLKK